MTAPLLKASCLQHCLLAPLRRAEARQPPSAHSPAATLADPVRMHAGSGSTGHCVSASTAPCARGKPLPSPQAFRAPPDHQTHPHQTIAAAWLTPCACVQAAAALDTVSALPQHTARGGSPSQALKRSGPDPVVRLTRTRRLLLAEQHSCIDNIGAAAAPPLPPALAMQHRPAPCLPVPVREDPAIPPAVLRAPARGATSFVCHDGGRPAFRVCPDHPRGMVYCRARTQEASCRAAKGPASHQRTSMPCSTRLASTQTMRDYQQRGGQLVPSQETKPEQPQQLAAAARNKGRACKGASQRAPFLTATHGFGVLGEQQLC